MKKKIAFFLVSLGVGGVEKSLVNLVEVLSEKDKYDIIIYCVDKKGEYLDLLEKYATIIEITKFKDTILYDYKQEVKNQIKKLHLITIIKMITKKLNQKLKKQDVNFNILNMQQLKEEFDIAISYQVPVSPIMLYVATKVKAKQKIVWNHADLSSVDIEIVKKYEKYIDMYDYILSVSEEANEKTKKILPKLSSKALTCYNVIPEEEIIKKSQQNVKFNEEYDGIKILTVARLAKGKGQDLAIEVTKKLIDNGYDIKWYAVGKGEFFKELKKKIKKLNIEKNYILLGLKENPYPYIKRCDIYVQTSDYEGACTTVMEAKVLNKPIITTNISGATKNFKDGETAIIVNYNVDEIYNAVKLLIDNEKLRKKLSDNLIKEENKVEKNNFEEIINLPEGE